MHSHIRFCAVGRLKTLEEVLPQLKTNPGYCFCLYFFKSVRQA